jgi:membrane-bound lytic murein transglycosylase B
MRILYKNLILIILSSLLVLNFGFAKEESESFESWLVSYKDFALKKGISKNTLDTTFKNVKFLKQVIKYDRKQPEFFEDTITYVSKRANNLRVKNAKKLLKENVSLFEKVENKFSVEKEILLALWGIETNFGKHVGKMDIISCLSTLSYDKRRRDFFSSQLLTLLFLIQDKKVDPSILYGSWAGAFGNFQFMPSTIDNYALDFDGNKIIDLKHSLDDSLASAANYLHKIGWKKAQPCFYRVKLNKKIKKKYFNTSARKLLYKLKVSD